MHIGSEAPVDQFAEEVDAVSDRNVKICNKIHSAIKGELTQHKEGGHSVMLICSVKTIMMNDIKSIAIILTSGRTSIIYVI